jgi:RNA polymerase sigma factor (sigma-70 family)
MSVEEPGDVLRHIRRSAFLHDGGGLTDGQLLECYLIRKDEAAFEALVRRHGPMVLGMCRRMLRHAQDAEDAFQATFLVLIRKAASISQRDLLGNWLYGVAYRTALDMRGNLTRLRAHEKQMGAMPEPKVEDREQTWRDLQPVLDQELNHLPDMYRVAIVLCDLQGRTRRDAARHLGIPAGTLSGRLTTARQLLASRLARNGLHLTCGGLVAALEPPFASACVPAATLATTVDAARTIAVGGMASQVISTRVQALAEGVMQTMVIKKVKTVTALLLVVVVAIGAGLFRPNAEGNPAQQPLKAEKPRSFDLGSRGRRVIWSPDGKTLAIVTINEALFFNRKGSAIKLWDVEKGEVIATLAESKLGGLAFQQAAFSPDGKTIAATVSEEIRLPDSVMIRDVVKVWDARTLALKRALGGDSQLVHVAFSPDGKRVAGCDPGRKIVNLWNLASGALERKLKIEEAQPWSLAFSPDGKLVAVGGQREDKTGEITLWEVNNGKLRHQWDLEHYANTVVFSPDGKRIASSDGGDLVKIWDVEKGEVMVSIKGNKRGPRSIAFFPNGAILAVGGPDGRVRLWNVRTGELLQTLSGHSAEVHSVAISPDGKTLASVSQDQTARLWPITTPNSGAK